MGLGLSELPPPLPPSLPPPPPPAPRAAPSSLCVTTPAARREPPPPAPSLHCSRCEIYNHHSTATCFRSLTAHSITIPLEYPCALCLGKGHRAVDCFRQESEAGYIPSYGIRTAPPSPDRATAQCCGHAGHTRAHCPRLQGLFDSRHPPAPPTRSQRVCNVMGSKHDLPLIGGTWLDEYFRACGPQYDCAVLGCDGVATVGAHVFLEGDRSTYYIAPFCAGCNHRHGHEEMCHCKFIKGGAEPLQWLALKNVWLRKMPVVKNMWAPFVAWCEEAPPTPHAYRELCHPLRCSGGGGAGESRGADGHKRGRE